MIDVFGAECEEDINLDELIVRVEEFRGEHDRFFQLFDPDMVVCKEHLEWAYDKAVYCLENGYNRADNLEIEMLLWSSGEMQIKNAIKKMGVKDGCKKMIAATDADIDLVLAEMNWKRDDSILSPSIEKLKNYGVTESELETTEDPLDLVFEKMATSLL